MPVDSSVEFPQSEGLIGKVESEFEYNRAKLLESMGKEVRNVIASYDKTEEARQLSNEVPPPSSSFSFFRSFHRFRASPPPQFLPNARLVELRNRAVIRSRRRSTPRLPSR